MCQNQRLSVRRFAGALLLLSISSSSASIHSRNRIFRPWGGKRIQLAPRQPSGSLLAASGPPSFLLVRGGAEKGKTKEASKDEDEDWDELVKSETIEEVGEDSDEGDQIDEDDDEEEEEENEDEYDNEEDEAAGTELEEASEYDELLVANPGLSMFATFGVIMLARNLDLYNPMVVRIARFAFIGYLVLLQLFVLYVRIRAKMVNNRTPVTTSIPLSGLLQSQLGGGEGGNDMVKKLASSFLSSESTVLEYDLKQAQGMQGGLLFNMAFMWLLHFKFQQIQPLMISTASGLINLVYSPLFQAYVLGRNLERPFKNPSMGNFEEAMAKHQEAMAKAQAAQAAAAAEREETTIDEEDETIEDSAESKEATLEEDVEDGADGEANTEEEASGDDKADEE